VPGGCRRTGPWWGSWPSSRRWARLAAAQVNAVARHPRGFLLLSADTLSGEPSLRPISVRRLLTLLRRLALAEGETFVFEPGDAFLADLVRHRFEEVLGDLYRRGAFAGATAGEGFRVVTDASVNPPASIDRGRFVAELRVAPARALAFLTVRLVGGGPELLSVEEVA
jgi:phage tail sheath protein FI